MWVNAIPRGQANRKVALKVIKVEMSHMASAVDHARALARLNHPNIVTVYDVVTVDVPGEGSHEAACMEWLEGLVRRFEFAFWNFFSHVFQRNFLSRGLLQTSIEDPSNSKPIHLLCVRKSTTYECESLFQKRESGCRNGLKVV